MTLTRPKDRLILIVGERGSDTNMIKGYLKEDGYRIASAFNGQDVVDLVNGDRPDLIILDDHIPGSDPSNLCEWLKGHASLMNIPVVMLLSFAGLADKLTCIEAGADEVLVKPVDKRELLVSVNRSMKLQTFHEQLISVENVIQSLGIAIESKDHFTRGHSIRVAEYSVQLAKTVSVPEADVKIIYRAAMLHDIGQIAIEESVLHKPEKLQPDEFEQVKQHPDIAVKILEPLHLPNELLEIIKHHHEWWNGHGYPDGLARQNIPLGARILSIADAFDAMTSERPYRAKMSMPMALNRLEDGANKQWDPDLVRTFLGFERAMLDRKPAEIRTENLWSDYKLR
ncbi:MAG: HD domain-containing phosphohydrolase [Actinomycetota bacterium]